MKKIIDSVTNVVSKKAAQATRQVFDSFEPEEKLALIGLGLIGLSIISEEKGGKRQKGSKKS